MLRSKEEVEAWVQANGGEEALRIAIHQKRFGYAPEAYAYINEWLREQEEERDMVVTEGDRDLRLREVQAAEISAAAAVRSARSARHSAMLAGAATAISLAALVLQYLKNG